METPPTKAVACRRADERLLSAVYTPLGQALKASPAQLGTMTMWRALVQVRCCARCHRCLCVRMSLSCHLAHKPCSLELELIYTPVVPHVCLLRCSSTWRHSSTPQQQLPCRRWRRR